MEITLEYLNHAVADGTIDEVIRVAEARQRKRLGAIADAICAKGGVRVVMIAGASSAGKTTTATRLCTQLRVNEREALLVSTDDYFVGDKRNPRDENGNLDYEHIECVDIPKFTEDMNDLLAGKTVMRRRFDFVKHEGYISDEERRLPEGGVIVVEGIHALNPRLCGGVDEAGRFGVFIDPVPSVDIFAGIKPKPQEARLLRRLVRDNHFRKMSPVDTFNMWPNVLAGEEKWINPFKSLADEHFDSYLCYELSVLKFYAGGLLEIARLELGERPEVMNLIRMLAPFTPVSSVSVPGDSILRETIGGSQLDY